LIIDLILSELLELALLNANSSSHIAYKYLKNLFV
jgi:hypothetical protein